VNEHLREFLEISLPPVKPGKKSKYQLGVAETKLAGAIQEALNIRCVSNDVTAELFRGIRMHADKLIAQFKEGDLAKAQLGLGHSFSRAKVRGAAAAGGGGAERRWLSGPTSLRLAVAPCRSSSM